MITGNENAFAVISFDSEGRICIERDGLTIRQKFAESAMKGLLSNLNICDGKDEETINWVSDGAVRFADALINALNKTQQP